MTKSSAQLDLEIDQILSEAAPKSTKTAAQLDREIIAATAPIADPERTAAYEDKLERKRQRLEKASARAAAKASAAFGTAHRIGDAIPFGQPILVGHHSERRHRGAIAKIDRSMRKGFESDDLAKEFAARAAAVGTAGISSDDPDAVRKLKVELNQLRLNHDKMKAGNAAIKKLAPDKDAQVAALKALGFSDSTINMATRRDFSQNANGFAVGNAGANIRRVEQRIAELVTKESTPARESIKGGDANLSWELRENKELNRTQIVFSGQPPKEMRDKLKHAAFKWAPSEGAWQRHMSNGAWYHAKQALGIG
jgi:hypothetical protein